MSSLLLTVLSWMCLPTIMSILPHTVLQGTCCLQVAEFVSDIMQSMMRLILTLEIKRKNRKCIKCICITYENIKIENDVKKRDIISCKKIETEKIVIQFEDLIFYKDNCASTDFGIRAHDPDVVQIHALTMIGKERCITNSHFQICFKVIFCKNDYSKAYLQNICSDFDADLLTFKAVCKSLPVVANFC